MKMNKNILLLLLLASGISKSEISLNEISYVEIEGESLDEKHIVPREWGVKGLEFSGTLTNISSDLKREKYYSLYHKYLLQETLNEILFEDLNTDNLDRENIIKLGYNHLNIDGKNNNGFNIMFGHLLDDNKRIGLNLNYLNSSYKSNLESKDIKAHMYSGNIFYYFKNDENSSDMFITIYGGTSKDKNSSIKEKTEYIGSYFIYSQGIEKLSNYDYFETRYFFKGDLSRTRHKIENYKENNDSINADLGIKTSKNLNFIKTDSKLGAKIAYSHEFMPNKKYKSYEEKDPYNGAVKGSIFGEIKVNEVLEVKADYSVKVGVSKSKTDNSFRVGFKLKI